MDYLLKKSRDIKSIISPIIIVEKPMYINVLNLNQPLSNVVNPPITIKKGNELNKNL